MNTLRSSIAVLAFEDMSPDRDQGYFCDGLAEEIINDLARVQGLRVASRTSSFAYKDKSEDIRVIGQKLNVESVLEGSVRKTDDRLRITAQLINAADGFHIWSKNYDREVQDIFAIQLEIAHSIARALKVELSEEERHALEKMPTTSIDAYYFYARTCFVQGKYEQAKELFLEASRVDPADYQSPALLAFLYKTIGQEEKMAPVLRDAMDRIERRLALNPDESRAIYLGADVLIRMGEKEKAMEWVKRLAATDRDEPAIIYGIACLYSLIGKPEEAVYYLGKAVDDGFAHRQYLEKDGDFDPIRNHPRYIELIKDLKRRENERL
ncbi:MAG: hypothetical protein WBM69_15990 [Desulfobacterales bacterium]